MAPEEDAVPRRSFLKVAATALAAGPAILTGFATARAADPARPSGSKSGHADVSAPGLVRIASVSTSVEGGVLPTLVESFKSETGLNVALTADDDPYDPDKTGQFDLIISHFGHRDTEKFVLKGFGLWPRTVFSNQLALFGPSSDPAKVRGLPDLVEAFHRIAETKAPYVLNETKGLKYLTETLWNAAGRPARGGWFVDSGASKKDAILQAAERKAYVFWGLTPFLREQKAAQGKLVPLVTADPLLQRIMVSIVVNPERVPGVNAAGASSFQKFLLLPSTQAKIMKIHYPGTEAVWAPAGRNNAGSALPA